MHLFRVVNQMSLKKDLKFTTTTPPPATGFFDDTEQMPDAQKMHSRSVAFYCRIRLRFFPVSFFIRSWVEEEILRYSKDVC